jgi:hypothetical protein
MADTSNARAAVVAPGRAYSAQAPLLAYAADAAEARGAAITALSWTPPRSLDPDQNPDPDKRVAWVCQEVTRVLDAPPVVGTAPLLIGKSLGSLAAPLAAERGLPAVWLTPLLGDDAVAQALRAATAPFLLVGGTADSSWDGALARRLSPHVYEVDGADHGMYIPGPLAASAAVLGLVVTAVERFLDETVWPASVATALR